MAGVRGVPPGRAGRLWLRRRLTTAERTRGQLDRKLHSLLVEGQRVALLEDRLRADWVRECALGTTWLARAALLSGRDGIRLATGPESLTAVVDRATTAGVSYPVTATVSRRPSPAPPHHATSALAPAGEAYLRAVEAGAALAAAEAASRLLGREIALTRRRLRALDKRWMPQLHESLRLLEGSLEQAEREDWARLRRQADTTFGP